MSQVFNLSSFSPTKCDKNEINWDEEGDDDEDEEEEIFKKFIFRVSYWFSHSITKGQTESINQQKPGHPTGTDDGEEWESKFLLTEIGVHCVNHFETSSFIGKK